MVLVQSSLKKETKKRKCSCSTSSPSRASSWWSVSTLLAVAMGFMAAWNLSFDNTTTTTSTTSSSIRLKPEAENVNANHGVLPTQSVAKRAQQQAAIQEQQRQDKIPILQEEEDPTGVLLPPKYIRNKNSQTANVCHGYHGILHIRWTDILGGVGTALIQLVVNQLLYAQRYNLVPFIHLEKNHSQVIYDAAVHNPPNLQTYTFSMLMGRNITWQRSRSENTQQQQHFSLYEYAATANAENHPLLRRFAKRDWVPGPPDTSQLVSRQQITLEGTGIWAHYFEPVGVTVHELMTDPSCHDMVFYTIQDLYLITPGLHGYHPDISTPSWRYEYLPEYVTTPHASLTAEWLAPARRRAATAMDTFSIVPRAYLRQAANTANPDCHSKDHTTGVVICLGLHIRHSDKAAGRRLLATSEFLPYATAFVETVSKLPTKHTPQIYLATDSSLVLAEIESSWPAEIRTVIRTAGSNILRSSDRQAVFDLALKHDGAPAAASTGHHRSNVEALVEILALSRCHYMIHGLSAMSEAAIWFHVDLHNRSVNLEDDDHFSVTEFETLVRSDLTGTRGPLPALPRETDKWWQDNSGNYQVKNDMDCSQFRELAPTTTNDDKEYQGILHISCTGRHAATGQSFFTSIVNQLLYAERYNLKPWIHLVSNYPDDSSELIYFASSNKTVRVSITVPRGFSPIKTLQDVPNMLYPGSPDSTREIETKEIDLPVHGIWDKYFLPVSDYHPVCTMSPTSSSSLPVFSLSEPLVSPGLQSYAPGYVRAWRYDNVPDNRWYPYQANGSLSRSTQEWYGGMRQQGHDIVAKYFRFQPYLIQRVDKVNPLIPQQGGCLAVHMRNNDKHGRHRKTIKAHQYLPYMEAYQRAGGRVIYLATDSRKAINYVFKNFPSDLVAMIRTQGIRTVVRSAEGWPTHALADHDRVNSETLVDIVAMSRCDWLLHTYSTVSEAVLYLNLRLHEKSVNLEEKQGRISPEQFERLVHESIPLKHTS